MKGIGGQKQQEREKRREREIAVTVQALCIHSTVGCNFKGERRGTGMTGGSGGRGEKNALFNLICYLQGRYRCPRSGLSAPGRYK